MLAEAKTNTLLYISDDAGGVNVYTYPAGKLVGQIGGFDVGGLCSDRAGHVFVTSPFYHDVDEFAHGGTQPIATFLGPGSEFNPASCSIDPGSNNLAVESADSNSVYIFKHEGQSATVYKNPFSYGVYCSYDGSGNFFVRGTQYHIAELPKGLSAFTNIKLSRPVKDLEGFAWDGKYLSIIGTPAANIDYRIRVRGARATIVSSSILTGAKSPRQFTIYHHHLIVPDQFAGQVTIWRYPRIGKPIAVIEQGLVEPEGSAISVAR
jgi:hypothetical protein